MSAKKTYLINIIAGPSAGKTTICALLFAELKIRGFCVEYVQEYAKTLVWTKNFDLLNNQYYVTQNQFNLMKQMIGEVEFIITDGSILHGLYYNRHNRDNTSNIEKTEKLIIDSYNQFNNINIFLDRGDFPYEVQGRIQNENEAKDIDVILKHMLKQMNINFVKVKSDASDENLEKIITYILDQTKK